MNPRHFLDTNIILYSISRDEAEASKREREAGLLESDDGALSVQVLQEFYVQATRLSQPDPLPHDIAAARALGCRELYSEDMSHGREVEGMIIINPFRT